MAYEPSTFYKGNVQTKRKVTSGSLEYYFFSIYPPVEIPKYFSGSAGETIGLNDFEQEGEDTVLVFFEPTHEQLFFKNHYEVLENNDESARRSRVYLNVDRDNSQHTPPNFGIISSSLEPNTRYLMNRNLFAEVQESNYESRGWTTSRYSGAKNTSRTDGVDPFLYLVNFEGYVFNNTITKSNIASTYSNLTPQTLYFHTPPLLSGNKLIPPFDYNLVAGNRTFLYTIGANREIATVNLSKVLDTRVGFIYVTDRTGKVTGAESLT